MTLLLQWIWQGTLLAFGLAAILRLAPRLNAVTRYALWWVALGIVLLLPLPALFEATSSAAAAGPFSTDVALVTAGAWQLPSPPGWLMPCLAGVWLASLLLTAGRLVVAVRTVHRLKAGSLPLAAAHARALPLWQQWPHRRAVLRTSPAVAGACALGLTGRPAIVLSRELVDALPPATLDLIVLHEQAHLSRYDDWTRLLQSAVMALFGLHPAVRFISARLDIEREAACDEAVARQAGDPRRYAACLSEVADLLTAPGTLIAPLAAVNAGGTGTLLLRVQRLLDPRIAFRAELRRPALLATALLLAVSGVLATAAGPVVTIAGALDTGSPSLLPGRSSGTGMVGLVPAAQGTRLARLDGLTGPGRELAPSPAAATARRLATVASTRREPLAQVSPAIDGEVAVPAGREPAPTSPTLTSRPLPDVIFAGGPNRVVAPGPPSGDNSWADGAAPVRRTGLAVGNAFTRAGKSIARRF